MKYIGELPDDFDPNELHESHYEREDEWNFDRKEKEERCLTSKYICNLTTKHPK